MVCNYSNVSGGTVDPVKQHAVDPDNSKQCTVFLPWLLKIRTMFLNARLEQSSHEWDYREYTALTNKRNSCLADIYPRCVRTEGCGCGGRRTLCCADGCESTTAAFKACHKEFDAAVKELVQEKKSDIKSAYPSPAPTVSPPSNNPAF